MNDTLPAIELCDAERWNHSKAINSDPYGAACLEFAERWARMMQAGIAKGAKLADIARDTSRAADTEGITWFMYGAAVAELSASWVHGEELRRWHNLDTQIGNEGERANETGGVLNPALLNIG